MKTDIFFNTLTSKKLNENFAKQFGSHVNLEKYTREELEDMRNKLRTRLFQHEGSAGYNELLTNETYQKDKAMLQLINTRIKEMLGEDIKKLRDKMNELSEAKKGERAPIHTKKAKGSDDKTGDGKTDFDDVQTARYMAGGMSKKAAVQKATSDEFKEDRKVQGTRYGGGRQDSKPEHDDKDHDTPKAKADQGHASITSTDPGKYGDAHSREERAKHKAGKSQIPGRVIKGKAQSGSKEDDNTTAEATERKAKVKPSKGMTKAEKSAVVKQAKKGKDLGEPGKKFKEIEKAAGGGKKGKKIAGAVFWRKMAAKEGLDTFRTNVRIVNESLRIMMAEDEEAKAKAITAASDMVNDFTSWMQRVGQYQTKAVIELADAIRADFGVEQAETFKQTVGPALEATLNTLMQQRETISNAVAVLAGEAVAPAEPMGAETAEVEPDRMNVGDEFAASDAAAGGAEASGREVRESQFSKKLAESHSIIAKLAK